MALYKPVEVKTRPNYRLWVKFTDGIEGEIDLAHLVGKGVFALWQKPGEFERCESVTVENSLRLRMLICALMQFTCR